MTFKKLCKLEWLLFLVLFSSLLWTAKPSEDNVKSLDGDGIRYINYSMSMHQHNVFGLGAYHTEPATSPQPGNANAPLYPLLITGVMFLDDNLAQSIACIVQRNPETTCAENFDSLFAIQVLISALSLYLIYYIVLQITGQKKVAWISSFLAFASGVFTEFSYIIMTEILIIPLFLIFLLFCLNLYKSKHFFWFFAIGAALGVLTLVRPSYLYLFYATILFFIGLCLFQKSRKTILGALSILLAFIVVVSPWSIRNKTQLDTFALTSGGYAEAILVQRTNYNQMSWAEVGVAMIYWLPDFGDSLAKNMFPEELHRKLGWGQDTYYSQQYAEKISSLSKELGGEERILSHLVMEEILTPKHVAVSLPLALRGLYIAKYWGLIGLIAFLFFLRKTVKEKDYSVLLLSLPLFFMVAFHAGLSVSISRYNLPLILVYALSMAWYINFYGQKCVTKFSKK